MIRLNVLAILSIFFIGCGDKDAANMSEDDSLVSVGSLSINPLAGSYPEGLSLSAFPDTENSSNQNLNLSDSPTDPHKHERPKHPKKALQDEKDRLEGKSDSCFTPNVVQKLFEMNQNVEACYGFDYGIVSGKSIGLIDQGKINDLTKELAEDDRTAENLKEKFDTGVTDKDESEACMVAAARQEVMKVTKTADTALELFQGMLCASKKLNTVEKLPKIGKKKDSKNLFKKMQGVTIEEAGIKRLKNQDRFPVFRSYIKLTNNQDSRTLVLIHSPEDDKNLKYKGVLQIRSEIKDGENIWEHGVSIKYRKSQVDDENSNLKYEVKKMRLNKAAGVKLFKPNGSVNFEDLEESWENSKVSNISYFAFDIDPSTTAGNMSFWMNPGGRDSEAARGFVFKTTKEADGTLKGTAYAGADRGMSIRKAFREKKRLKVTGCFTPFSKKVKCGDGTNNMSDQFWKQEFKQNPETGKYVETSAGDGYEVLTNTDELPTVDLSDMKGVSKTED